jgi:hypothetical protein
VSGDERRRLLLAAAAAIAAVGAVVWVAHTSTPAPAGLSSGLRPGGPYERGQERADTESALGASAAPRTTRDETYVPPAPSADDQDLAEVPEGVVSVRVIGLPERTGVPGAEVRLLLETPESLALGWASLAAGSDVPPEVTDAEGRARLAWDAAEGSRRLVVCAPGYAVSEARLETAPRRGALVTLSRGLAIEGQVVTPAGSRVADVEIQALAVRRPRATFPEEDLVPMAGAERVRVKADGEGHFRIAGLSAGSYLVAPVSGGWLAVADRVPSSLQPMPGGEGVLAEAGANGVRLVVERHAAIVLRLLDLRTGEPIAATWSAATVRLPGQTEPVAWTSFASRRPWVPTASDTVRAREVATEGASWVQVAVPWDGTAREAEVELRAAGYLPARVASVPRPVSEDAVPVQVVPLEPDVAEGGCRLVLDCARESRGRSRPATRLLTLCRENDAARTHRAGCVHADGRIEFVDLPAGEFLAEVWDGWSRSTPVRVTLAVDKAAEAKAEFGPLTGAVFELREERGGRVFDADVLLIGTEGRDRGLPNRAAATALVPGESLVVPLEPGRHRYAVQKNGVGYDAGHFDVAAGTVVTVRARLGSIKRFDTGQRVAPRPR